MAATYTALGDPSNVGQHRCKFRVNSDGAGGGTAQIANADILAQLKSNSPLRAAFNQTFASQNAARDALTNTDRVSIYVTRRSGAAQVLCDINVVQSRPVVEVALDAASSEVLVEIVFMNSLAR